MSNASTPIQEIIDNFIAHYSKSLEEATDFNAARRSYTYHIEWLRDAVAGTEFLDALNERIHQIEAQHKANEFHTKFMKWIIEGKPDAAANTFGNQSLSIAAAQLRAQNQAYALGLSGAQNQLQNSIGAPLGLHTPPPPPPPEYPDLLQKIKGVWCK